MPYDHLIDAATDRTTGPLDLWALGYLTDGGTWVLARVPEVNDDDQPHDLVMVLPLPLDGTRVLALRPTVNPGLVAALRTALDEGNTHRLVLHFDEAESLHEALDHIGDEDAPIFLGQGPSRLETEHRTYPLWSGFNEAAADLRRQES